METATTADSVAGGDWMPLAEAAVIEGVKSLAIRRRIEAGTMVGERRRTAGDGSSVFTPSSRP